MKASQEKMEKALAAASGELSEEQLDTAVGGAMMTGHSPLTVNLLEPLGKDHMQTVHAYSLKSEDIWSCFGPLRSD